MTWQLAIETSGSTGSLALLERNIVHREIDFPSNHSTTQSLSIAMHDLLVGIPAGQPLGLVSVSIGPGSFTGLRIGVTAAKTLCFARKTDLVALDTLAILCDCQRENLLIRLPDRDQADAKIAVATNAYRGQVFTRIEPLIADQAPLTESRIVERAEWDAIAEQENYYTSGPANGNWPRPVASAVGKLAWRAYEAGQRDDFWSLRPAYIRRSAAEEKADQP